MFNNYRISKRSENTLNKSNGFSLSYLNKKDGYSKNNSSSNINGALDDTLTKYKYRGKSGYSTSRYLDNSKTTEVIYELFRTKRE
jgi:hypothetical protein